MRPIYKMFAVTLLAMPLMACLDDDDDDEVGNIVEVARENGSFTTLVAALEQTGLDAALANDAGTFTVFAPTDQAFIDLGVDLGTLTAERLTDILTYHVVSGSLIDSTAAIAAAGTTVTAFNNDELGVKVDGSDLFINASQVIIPNVDASNGIIHAIDRVLIPTEDMMTSGDIPTVATGAGLSTLVSLIGLTSDLGTVLSGEGPFTVFAPTDAAFTALEAANPGIKATLTADPNGALRDVLLYHVVSGKEINSSAATAIAGNKVEMANTDDVALSLTGAELFANISGVVGGLADVDTSNGIVHVIDTVLLPPEDQTPTQDIVAIASGNSDFSDLVGFLGATSDLVGLLQGPGPFTVFAPTNAAFTALELANPGITATLGADPDGALRDVLMKHVLAGEVDSVTAFTFNGVPVTTANEDGETITPVIDSGSLTVNGAEVTTFDIQATNGVIHVIDAVITLDP